MSWLDRERKAGDVSTIFEVVGLLVMLGLFVYYLVT